MDEPLTLLERQYCPPLDPTLITAIAYEYDLHNSQQLENVKKTLDDLKDVTVQHEEQTIAFDPSGTGGIEEWANDPDTHRSQDHQLSGAADTDTTSLSNGFRDLSTEDGSGTSGSHGNGAIYGTEEEERLSEEQKVKRLVDMFPNAKEFGIRHTLQKCDGSWNRAIEELLNHHFFEELDGDDKVFRKGVEGFSADQVLSSRSKKHGKNKRRSRIVGDSLPSTPSPSTRASNPWEASRKDIDFITSRIGLPHNNVASAYHASGASLPMTIVALLESKSTQDVLAVPADDPLIVVQATDLREDFPSISMDHAVTITRLTHPSTATAHELGKALVTVPDQSSPRKANNQGRIQVITNYAPINLSDEDDDAQWSSVTSKQRPSSGANYADSSALASQYYGQRDHFHAQASAAYRRGRSDHLMGGAAAYYSQQSRDYATRARDVTSDAADALVDEQSTSDTIDLHYVSTKDAVRIARAKTEAWWRSRRGVMGLDGRLGEREGGAGLRIMTGVGRHSVGGRGKLGPAVGAMLFNEGWRVEVGEGIFTVRGKRR